MSFHYVKRVIKNSLKKSLSQPHPFRLLFYLADLKNIIHYGRCAPLKHQLLYVKASDVKCAPFTYDGKVECTDAKTRIDVVLGGNWGGNLIDLDDIKESGRWERYLMAKEKVMQGVGWDDVAHSKYLEPSSKDRVKKIEYVIKQAVNNGKFPSESELTPGKFREFGGIGIMISAKGEVLKAKEGHNRLGIAHGAGVNIIPVCLMVVHPDAITSGKWADIRKQSERYKKLCQSNDAGV
jgi:hypothetical protein